MHGRAGGWGEAGARAGGWNGRDGQTDGRAGVAGAGRAVRVRESGGAGGRAGGRCDGVCYSGRAPDECGQCGGDGAACEGRGYADPRFPSAAPRRATRPAAAPAALLAVAAAGVAAAATAGRP